MLKKLFLVTLLAGAPLFAAEPVAFSGHVGAKTDLDGEALYMLRAVQAAPADFARLTQGGYYISSVQVEVLPSKSEEDFSDITRYTFISTRRGSILDIGRPQRLKQRRLVLQAYFNKHIQDDVPYTWESSGVVAN
jgi:hypothetical protein